MRILNGRLFIDDVSLVRTDGHSVTMRDPTGTSLVIPLNVLNDVMEKVSDAKEKSLQVKETTE
jgi:hypothetical protein